MDVNYLVATPLARGLIARAIASSDADMWQRSPSNWTWQKSSSILMLKDAEEVGVKFAAEHRAKGIAELRATSAADLVQAKFSFRPVVDGYVLPVDVYTTFERGTQQDVPTIVGWTSGDGTMFRDDSGMPTKAAEFPDAARKRFGPMADEFLKVFPVTSDADVPNAQAAIVSTDWMGWVSRAWGRLQAKTGKSNIYLYYWDHMPPVIEASKRFGAFHGSDIVYELNTLDTSNPPWRPADRKLADVMSSYCVNFAKTGDPNGPGLPRWPNFTAGSEQSMGFAETIAAIPTPQKQEIDFWDDWYAMQRQ
ncbi:hypothetical protein AYJ54_42925 [Bradyrhizobium centrolobii]|uniref:Carboxylesterase type B domain-containing protein n=1 Tax=Bradyrhizobium centrolobii TaxID=1505087 RepID=A0A176Z0X4_9BRAD|nr:carboxylesterase family protein [Bradyrhizobium centrolobii]OAF14060.1 hypothetical protein AYJ54_42925 [Bradyrhizobium centrolobii]